MRVAGMACIVAALSGCSSEAPATRTPDAGTDAGVAPAPPSIPWLAVGVPPIAITPCPPGWREVHEGDVATCDPYPEPGPEICAEGFAHFPGGSGCEPVGSACPTGEWSDGLAAVGVLYVRAGAAAGGDGTRTAPFARIGDAMSAASVGSVVALTRGRWDEVVRMRQGVTLQGACAAETVLTSSVPTEAAGVLGVTVRGAQLRDVRIDGASRPGLVVTGAAAEVRIEGVIVSGARAAGVYVDTGAHLTAARLVVRDTRSAQSDRAFGVGLVVQDGASAEVTRGLFERNRSLGVTAAGAATSVRLEDVVVRDTQSQESDGALGRGLEVQAGASAEVTRGLFERNRETGVHVSDATTSVRLEDVVVRDTQSRELTRTGGSGLDVQGGASAEVTRVLFERNRQVAVFADQPGTILRLADVVVRDTQSQESDLDLGRGLSIQGGVSVTTSRVLFERNHEIGVYVDGAGTRLSLEDVVVRDTQSRQSDQAFGRSLHVQLGGRVELTRGLLERNREVAVLATGAGTSVALADVVVRDTLPADCGAACVLGAGGVGVGSYEAATVSMRQFVTERAALCGMMIALAGGLDLSDGQVRESAIGACVQVPDYSISRLDTRVSYVDNGTNIAATNLPVPGASTTLTGP